MDAFFQDVRYGLRRLRNSPGLTATALLSLALGIGAATAVFSLMNTLMLRPLPVPRPSEIVEPLSQYPGEPLCNCIGFYGGGSREEVTIRDLVKSVDLAATSGPGPAGRVDVILEGSSAREFIEAANASGTFFQVLGVKPALGRLIQPEDDRKGAPPVAVVGWTYWDRAWQRSPSILGARIRINDVTATIVGVVERGFTGILSGFPKELWLPTTAAPWVGPTQLIGRLKAGVSIDQARAELIQVRTALLDESARRSTFDPNLRKIRTDLQPAASGLGAYRRDYETALKILMAVVAVLLAIACSNVAGMLLARGVAREHELSLRIAVGAGRGRIVGQALTQSLLLATLGGMAGLVVAAAGVCAIQSILLSARFPVHLHVVIDWNLALFGLAASVVTGLAFGLIPAICALRADPAAALRVRASESPMGRRFGRSLVALQVALSVVVLCAGAVFVTYLKNLRRTDLGFQRDHLLTAQIDARGAGYNTQRLAQGQREILAQLASTPGVVAAAFASWLPITGVGASSPIQVQGRNRRRRR